MRRALLCGVLALAVAVPAASAARAPKAAVAVAKAHVTGKLLIGGLQSIAGLRSRRNPRWALVDGYYTRPKRAHGPGLWSVWLYRTSAGWKVRYAGRDGKAIRPPARLRVPCDLYPAFSEPSC